MVFSIHFPKDVEGEEVTIFQRACVSVCPPAMHILYSSHFRIQTCDENKPPLIGPCCESEEQRKPQSPQLLGIGEHGG